jgi:hypothetical protein
LDASFVFLRKINSVDTSIPQRKGKYITLLRAYGEMQKMEEIF